jgi:hypothetical protein
MSFGDTFLETQFVLWDKKYIPDSVAHQVPTTNEVM